MVVTTFNVEASGSSGTKGSSAPSRHMLALNGQVYLHGPVGVSDHDSDVVSSSEPTLEIVRHGSTVWYSALGVHDTPARAIAISILTQLQATLSVTGKAVKFAMLPVLVACVE
ncbi:hypothetical protein BO82DRAFT_397344 [Aspergillus uvarum CBS 121591]|uniref:Uncharacterized protein n=1 Tax=Aspergillus uvarum CBS 121591 TaxID=1448315 RepID=A0A319CRE9_9EURO|nr:hypothetical protein BO82DRAFT_397344 [Aspergillus uvarum CBS 121591]PYH86771.1 hypothetical protein BO82DRAFT_397344 [Aspergillus uvarum CBS 121591]